MKFKKYITNDMKEACQRIREDLGADAVIINSRKVTQKGLLGFLKPRMLEVTAAIDDINQAKQPLKPKRAHFPEDIISKEMREMKGLLEKLLIQNGQSFHEQGASALDGNATINASNILDRFFAEQEVLPSTAKKILSAFTEEELQLCSSGWELMDMLKGKLEKIFVPVTRENHLSRLMVFIGPTGVGKTTTIAKLAANFALYHGLNIGLVTIDTYRIGAVAQLKTYGEIIGVTVDVVMTPHELKMTLQKYARCDLILLDTAGRSSKNIEQIAELKSFLDVVRPAEIYLVMSANTKNKDLLTILDNYKSLNYSKLVITKIDETDSLGCLVNVADITGLPVAYVTNGQNVPDDIIPGEPERLAKLIVGEVG
ncbi:MAG: flagellar biosynthesis protein FlhF [Bacillota bacterium]